MTIGWQSNVFSHTELWIYCCNFISVNWLNFAQYFPLPSFYDMFFFSSDFSPILVTELPLHLWLNSPTSYCATWFFAHFYGMCHEHCKYENKDTNKQFKESFACDLHMSVNEKNVLLIWMSNQIISLFGQTCQTIITH